MNHHPATRMTTALAPPAPPAVVDGEVLWAIDIAPYPDATTPLGGCTAMRGRTVTDPDEIAAIARRVGGAR